MIIYCIKCKVNGKSYVGQTKDFKRRKSEYLREYKNKNTYAFYSDMRRHGVDKFEWSIIKDYGEQPNLHKEEKFWIKKLNTKFPNGYNISSGGNSWAWKNPEEAKRKISMSRIGKSTSENQKKAVSLAASGENNPKAKITKEDVQKIRSMYIPRKFGYEKIGKIFGITKSTVHKIVNGITWKEQ